jgi:hypothetical protein
MMPLDCSKTGNAKLRVMLCLVMFFCLTTMAMPCLATPAPVLHVCVNIKTGATTAKTKCTAKKEVPFTPQMIRNLDGNGFNVYDSTGRVLGPLIGIGETVITIGTAKYWTTFTENSIGVGFNNLYFSGSNCTGTVYTDAQTQADRTFDLGFVQYSGIGTLGVALNNAELYVTSGPQLNAMNYESYEHDTGPCTEGQLIATPVTPVVHQVIAVGSSLGTIVPPFDVR